MNTAFITGHRFIDFPIVKKGIERMTDLAIKREMKMFLTGMALGTDQQAAIIWTERRLPWKAILPCSDQSNLWTYKQQILYRKLLTKASEVKILYPKYSHGVMQSRNAWLVKNSQLCLAVWDGRETGGTYLTIEMARKAKLPLIIFNPKTSEISVEEPLKQLSLFDQNQLPLNDVGVFWTIPMYQRHPYQWTIHSAFPGADFWLIAKHNQKMLGKPIQEYKNGCFGMLAPQNIDPNYGFYLCQYLYNEGFWQSYSYGSLNLKHLRITDVRDVFEPDSYLVSPTGNLIVLSSSFQLATA